MIVNKIAFFTWCCGIVSLVATFSAQGQSGAFSGSTSEGSDIYIEFTTDATGAPQIFFYPSEYQLRCEVGVPRSLGGAYQVPITPDGSAWTFSLTRRDVALKGALAISADGGSMKGNFSIGMPLFTDVLTDSDSVTRCKTRRLTFQAALIQATLLPDIPYPAISTMRKAQ